MGNETFIFIPHSLFPYVISHMAYVICLTDYLFHLERIFISRDSLVKDVVFDRHVNVVEARLETLERDQTRQRHLLAVDRAQSVLTVFLDPHYLFAFLR